jgi:hypothetical protein
MTANCAKCPIVKETRITTKTHIEDYIKTVTNYEWTGNAQRTHQSPAPRISQTAAGPEANIYLFRNEVHIFQIFLKFLNFVAYHYN